MVDLLYGPGGVARLKIGKKKTETKKDSVTSSDLTEDEFNDVMKWKDGE